MKKSFRKSQAAMEFLMTYGWAILVVLVAIGALAYFGVLSPDRFLPRKCQLPSGIACTDFAINAGAAGAGTVEVVLRNGLGFDIDPIAVTLKAGSICDSDADIVGAAILANDCAAGATALPNGDMCTYQFTCPDALNEDIKFNADLVVNYRNIDSGLTHDSKGTITGRVE